MNQGKAPQPAGGGTALCFSRLPILGAWGRGRVKCKAQERSQHEGAPWDPMAWARLALPRDPNFFPALKSQARENHAPSRKARKVREPACHPGTGLQAPGPRGNLSLPVPRSLSLGVGAASPTRLGGRTHFESRGGEPVPGGAGSRVSPSPTFPARSRRGHSGSAAAARRLSYSASSWTRRQTTEQGRCAARRLRPLLLRVRGGLPAR